MSAFAYIELQDVPISIKESASWRIDETNGAHLVSFDGCPLIGEMTGIGNVMQTVEYPFPRNTQIRNDLIAWLVHWGIHFRVVM